MALGRLSPRVNRALRVEVEPARCLRHRIPYLGHRVGSTFWQNNPLSRYADVIKSAELGAQAREESQIDSESSVTREELEHLFAYELRVANADILKLKVCNRDERYMTKPDLLEMKR